MPDAAPRHPFDEAIHLAPADPGPGTVPGGRVYTGHTHPAYANMVGPFGGITAATLLQAALIHPQRLGDPVALTVNFAGPVADGPFTVEATPLRTNRSTQHWAILQRQGEEVTSSATAVFALRRDTWAATELACPEAPPIEALPRTDVGAIVPWTRQYEMRFVHGPLIGPARPDDERDSRSLLWLRDEPQRPLDVAALAALCDAFFPRILIRRPRRVPFGTVSMTSYFHADTAQLAAQGSQPLLGEARASHFGRGYHDQTAELWGADGRLLANTHQVVYFKE